MLGITTFRVPRADPLKAVDVRFRDKPLD